VLNWLSTETTLPFRGSVVPHLQGLRARTKRLLPASRWFLAWLIPRLWRWRWHILPKRRLSVSGLRGIIFQPMELSVEDKVTWLSWFGILGRRLEQPPPPPKEDYSVMLCSLVRLTDVSEESAASNIMVEECCFLSIWRLITGVSEESAASVLRVEEYILLSIVRLLYIEFILLWR
jgi:hypothetical protein